MVDRNRLLNAALECQEGAKEILQSLRELEAVIEGQREMINLLIEYIVEHDRKESQ